MAKEMSITAAREALTSLPEELERERGAIMVTRRGRPALAILPWGLYESLLETLEILGDPKQMAELRRAMDDVAAGRVRPWEDVRRELGL